MMIRTYKTKSVCVVDFGLFVELAVSLTKYFGKVSYHFPWQASAFPRSNSKVVGKGMGLNIAESLWDIVAETDCFVFPDVFLGDIQEELAAQGKLVFGSRKADELELYRDQAKKHFKKLGIPVGPYEVVKGLAALRQYLKEHKNQYVKCSVNRGDFETFAAPDYKFIEPKIDELEHSLGFKKYDQRFVVEAALPDCVEIGYDGFTIDGQYPEQSLIGIEIKDKGYVGRMMPYDKMPKQVTEFNKRIAPTLKKYKCRNFFSTELRVNRQGRAYILDPCVRAGNPPCSTELEFYDNLGEIIWEGAHGRVVTPTSKYQWAAQIQISSDWLDVNRLTVQFPEHLRSQVKLLNAAKLQGQYYIIPQGHKLKSVGAVVGAGNTMEEAIKQAKKVANEVKGHFIECNPGALDDAKLEWGKFKDFGITV